MSLSPETIDALVLAGATAEMLAAAFKAELAATEAKRTAKREGARERKRKQRERDASVTRDMRDDAGHSVTERDSLSLSVSPKPPSTNPNPVTPLNPPSPKPAEPDLKAVSEEIWQLQPVVGGKRRSTRPDVLKALRAAVDRRGQDPARIIAACRAYYRLPDCRKDGGQFASGAAVILAEDRWRDFEPAARERPPPKPEPAIYAAHVRHFRDTGEWKPSWGDKPSLESAA